MYCSQQLDISSRQLVATTCSEKVSQKIMLFFSETSKGFSGRLQSRRFDSRSGGIGGKLGKDFLVDCSRGDSIRDREVLAAPHYSRSGSKVRKQAMCSTLARISLTRTLN